MQEVHGGEGVVKKECLSPKKESAGSVSSEDSSGLVESFFKSANKKHSSRKRKAHHSCPSCPLEFTDNTSLEYHFQTIHQSSHHIQSPAYQSDLMYCSQCSKEFNNIYDLAGHMHNTHMNSNSYTTADPSEPPNNKIQQLIDSALTAQLFNNLQYDPSLLSAPTHNSTNLLQQRNNTPIHQQHSNNNTSTQAKQNKNSPTLQKHNNIPPQQHHNNNQLQQQLAHCCVECLKPFHKAEELQTHLLLNHIQYLFKCSLCKIIFDSKVDLQVHMAVKHTNECPAFKCSYCPELLFSTESECKLHLKIHHPTTTTSHLKIHNPTTTPPAPPHPYKCLFCKESFLFEDDLVAHISAHEKQFVCVFCKETFFLDSMLQKHLETCQRSVSFEHNNMEKSPNSKPFSIHNPSLLACSYSALENKLSSSTLQKQQQRRRDYATTTTTFDSNNNITSNNKQEFVCSYCKHVMKNRVELDKHTKLYHILPNNQKCNICDKVCSSPVCLAEHKLSHCKVVESTQCTVCKLDLDTEKEFFSHCHDHSFQGNNMQCVVCRQTLSSALEMHLHCKHHFQNSLPKDESFSCAVCSSLVNDTDEIQILKSLQSEENMQTCLKCFTKFFMRGCPIKGQKYRSSKTFQCIKCQQSFSSEYQIQLHVTSHLLTEGCKQECKLCSDEFDSPAKLQLHLVEHSFDQTGIMACPVCQQVHTSASGLFEHVMGDHGSSFKSHSCLFCPLTFFFIAELTNHIIVCHPNDTSPSPHGSHSSPASDHSSTTSYPSSSNPHAKAYLALARSGSQRRFLQSFHQSLKCKLLEGQKDHKNTKTQHPCPVCGGRFSLPADLAHHIHKIHNIQIQYRNCGSGGDVGDDNGGGVDGREVDNGSGGRKVGSCKDSVVDGSFVRKIGGGSVDGYKERSGSGNIREEGGGGSREGSGVKRRSGGSRDSSVGGVKKEVEDQDVLPDTTNFDVAQD